jgi:hypothetical protein
MRQVRGAPLRHKLLLVVVLAALTLCIWPAYTPAARVEPYVLSLPFGLAWIVLCLLLVFLALALTFRADMRAAREAARRAG